MSYSSVKSHYFLLCRKMIAVIGNLCLFILNLFGPCASRSLRDLSTFTGILGRSAYDVHQVVCHKDMRPSMFSHYHLIFYDPCIPTIYIGQRLGSSVRQAGRWVRGLPRVESLAQTGWVPLSNDQRLQLDPLAPRVPRERAGFRTECKNAQTTNKSLALNVPCSLFNSCPGLVAILGP